MSELRERTTADVDTVIGWVPDAAALYRFAGPRLTWPLTAQQMHDSAAAEGATAWVMDVEQRLVGHAQLTRCGDAVRLGRVLIDPTQRGRGLGRRLVASAVERARQQGAVRVDLSVLADNPAARRIYATLGFTPAPVQEASDMIAMTRNL
ncbi:GNAT family N-acetyltransferase [Kineococcus aurantiacus]|uniref:GNAT superfamily N-acetyltransferase n=1 Tax=Kineococcus aurantiacus TaxID=37633 RepID=A0A7Y9J312_9ACTN|nr:GNAT superfamily N-acetyltransferase [Kineococcus aurantiacus]